MQKRFLECECAGLTGEVEKRLETRAAREKSWGGQCSHLKCWKRKATRDHAALRFIVSERR